MNRILVFAILLISLSSYSQSTIDSLESILKQTSSDSTRVKILHQLFDEYRFETPSTARKNILQAINASDQAGLDRLTVDGINRFADFLSSRANYDSAIIEYEKALLIAEKIEYHAGKSECLIGLGNTYWRKGSLRKAQEYQERNLLFSQSTGDEDGVASSLNNLGNIYNELGEYTKAMEHYTLASNKYDELGNIRNVGITSANIAMIHSKLGNYQKAIAYYTQSDSIFRHLDFSIGNAFVAKSLAIIYKNVGDWEQSLLYNEQALKIYHKTGQLKEIGQITHNIGNLYWEQDQFKKSLIYYKRVDSLNTKIGDSIGMAMSSKALGTNYLDLGQLDSARIYSQKALDIATELGVMLTAMDANETLAEVYRAQNDLVSAYAYLSRYIDLKDSLYTIEKRDLAAEIEAKYQNTANQKEIALLESENKVQELQIDKRQNERNGLIILSIVILAGLVLIFNQYRIKQAANKKLRELDRMKSIFFENLSHEFRTPLSLILAPVKDRLRKTSSKEDIQLFNTIIKSAENLDELIKELLDLAKLEKGMLAVNAKELEARQLFKIIAASYESLAAVKKIQFDVKIPDEEQWLLLDEEIVKKICHNLLSNAYKFSPDESTITFEISYSECLQVQVTDSGPGIPKEDQPFIFDRFYQVGGPHASGTGIGLALTKELIEAVGGEITLESVVGEGSSFNVSIPLKKAQPKETTKTEPSKVPLAIVDDEPVDLSSAKKDLLIIEDNEDLRTYLSSLFSDEFNVRTATDGQIGIDLAKEQIPELIISDIMMDNMDGLDVCKTLKSNIETDHIPIILLTARSDQKTKLTGLKHGADAYLLKPFEAEELRVTTNNLIKQREKLRARYSNLELADSEGIEEKPPFIQKCEQIILDHLSADSFSADDFAKEIGMSRMQVHRKLKAMTDLSTTAFIRHHRLLVAKSLLEQGEPVSQTAYAVGFSSLSYFTKNFKDQFGIAPSQVNSKADQVS